MKDAWIWFLFHQDPPSFLVICSRSFSTFVVGFDYSFTCPWGSMAIPLKPSESQLECIFMQMSDVPLSFVPMAKTSAFRLNSFSLPTAWLNKKAALAAETSLNNTNKNLFQRTFYWMLRKISKKTLVWRLRKQRTSQRKQRRFRCFWAGCQGLGEALLRCWAGRRRFGQRFGRLT